MKKEYVFARRIPVGESSPFYVIEVPFGSGLHELDEVMAGDTFIADTCSMQIKDFCPGNFFLKAELIKKWNPVVFDDNAAEREFAISVDDDVVRLIEVPLGSNLHEDDEVCAGGEYIFIKGNSFAVPNVSATIDALYKAFPEHYKATRMGSWTKVKKGDKEV